MSTRAASRRHAFGLHPLNHRRERFPTADELILGWPEDVFRKIPLGRESDGAELDQRGEPILVAGRCHRKPTFPPFMELTPYASLEAVRHQPHGRHARLQ
jgi:hypothetical protein